MGEHMRNTPVDVCLPTHPTLQHPRTGAPVRAVGFSRRGPIWPILGGDGTDNGVQQGGQGGGQSGGGEGGQTAGGQAGSGAAGGQSGGQGAGQQAGAAGQGGSGSDTDADRGYPANTPVADMTTVQQAAYWKYHSRKHEGALRGLGLTAGNETTELQQLRAAQAELTRRENAELSDVERLTKERDELAVKAQGLEIAQIRANAAAAAKLPADMAEFITAVEPDKAAEQAQKLAERLVPTGTGNSGAGGGHDQGHRGGTSTKGGVSAGRDRYAERNKKTTTTT